MTPDPASCSRTQGTRWLRSSAGSPSSRCSALGWPMRWPAGRRSCRSRARPESARRPCSMHFLTEIAESRRRPPVVIRASGEETEELLAYGVVEQLARSIVRPRSARIARRSGHGRHQIAGVPRPVRRLAGRAGRRRRALGRPAVPAGADLRAPPAGRRPGADRDRGPRGQRCGPAGQPAPVGQRAAGHRPAIARTGRAGPARSRRGDGHRRHRRERGPPAAVRHAGKSVARAGAAGGVPGPPNGVGTWSSAPWGADDQLLPSPRVLPPAGAGAVRDVGAGHPPAGRRGRRARAALPVAAGRGAGRRRPTRSSRSTRPRALDLLRVSEAPSPWTLSFPHPLVRAAVYEALGPARRHALHTAAASLTDDESAALRHRVAAAAEPDEVLAADLTRFADREASRQSLAKCCGASGFGQPAEPGPGRGATPGAAGGGLDDAAWRCRDRRGSTPTRSPRMPPGPLRDAVLGSLAMAAENPAGPDNCSTRAWVRPRRPSLTPHDRLSIRRTTATVALLHGDPPVRPAGRRGDGVLVRTGPGGHRPVIELLGELTAVRSQSPTWCTAGLRRPAPPSRSRRPIGRANCPAITASSGSTRARPAGCCSWSTTTSTPPVPICESAAGTASRLGHPEHRGVQLRLPRPRRVDGRRLGRCPAARRAGGGDQRRVRLRLHAVGRGRHRRARPGRPRRLGHRRGLPAVHDRERHAVTSARLSRSAWPAPGSARPAATPTRCSPRSTRSAGSPTGTPSTSRGSGPWQDLLRRRAGRGRPGTAEADGFLVGHEERRAERGRRRPRSPVGPRPRSGRGSAGRDRDTRRRPSTARWRLTDGLAVPVRTGPDRTGGRAVPAPGRAAGGGPSTC